MPLPLSSSKIGIRYAILGKEEMCTGDPVRRAGNEFLFQMMAYQNIQTLNNYGDKKDRHRLPPLLQHPAQRISRTGWTI